MSSMQKENLERIVEKMKWTDLCSIDKHEDNRICLVEQNGTWQMFFYERGSKWDLLEFDDEQSAVLAFFGWVCFEKYRSGELLRNELPNA